MSLRNHRTFTRTFVRRLFASEKATWRLHAHCEEDGKKNKKNIKNEKTKIAIR